MSARVAVVPEIPKSHPLNKREVQVVELVCEGLTNVQIGLQMGITQKTVDSYRTRVYFKLKIHSVVDLVRWAIRNGLVKP